MFTNSEMLQHSGDKVIFFVREAFEVKLIGLKCIGIVVKYDSIFKGRF